MTRHEIRLPGRTLAIFAYASLDPLLEGCASAEDIPFWAELWPAARGLALYLWRYDLQGRTVLELGAGTGLGGIAAALRGARVVQTDYVRRALALARINARYNGVRGVRWRLGDWRNFPALGAFDLILGADILYEPSLHPYLRSIFLHHLRPGGSVLLADPGRLAAERFIVDREREGWEWSLDEIALPDQGRIHLLQLTPPGPPSPAPRTGR